MYKLIENSFFNDEPTVDIICKENIFGLIKSAGDERISEFAKTIVPHNEKIFIHINALGSYEGWGANRNADAFPESNLIDCYKTFETSAGIYRHHVNKDKSKSLGKILFSIYNPRMRRVELIVEMDKTKGQDIVERIEGGEYPATSMATRTPYDICSICGNKAHTRQEYCKHLKFELGRQYPDGKKCMALNVAPLTFIDISWVIKPADVTSGALQKIAYAEEIIGSAEMAELENVGEIKMASHRKLADIIKEIDGTIDAASPELDKIIFKTKDLDLDIVRQLKVFNLSDIIHVLADLGISPSLEFLSELIARKTLGDEWIGKGKEIADFIRSEQSGEHEIPQVSFKEPERYNIMVARLLRPFMETSSLLPEYVEKRASSGYASFNPYGYEEPSSPTPVPEHHYIKTLLTIGGIALLAKLYISSLIEKKLNETRFNTDFQNRAKIAIVKKASDYSTALVLIKYSTAKDFKDRSDMGYKNLDSIAEETAKILKATNKPLGSKASKIIKTIRIGETMINKITEGN